MASYEESKQAWVDYTKSLQEQNEALRTALTEAQATAQSNADALAAFQADDAATDAAALADRSRRSLMIWLALWPLCRRRR